MLASLARAASRARAAAVLCDAAATAWRGFGGASGRAAAVAVGRAATDGGRPFAAKAHKNAKPSKRAAADAAAPSSADTSPTGVDYDALSSRLDAALDHLRRSLAALRTGRAAPSLLEHVPVRGAYGDSGGGGHAPPLKALATVTARDAATLVVAPYDPSTVTAVAAAIRDSPLGLNPGIEGGEVVVPVPKPTKEAAQAMVKVARAEAEAARVSLRAARRDANAQAKRAASTDDARRDEKKVQGLVETAEKEVGALLAAKEKDLKAV